jgi:hypothetical protein
VNGIARVHQFREHLIESATIVDPRQGVMAGLLGELTLLLLKI